MRIMTYNLLNGAEGQFDDVIKVINTQNPDFLTINEANGFDLENNKSLVSLSRQTSLPFFYLAKCGDGDGYHIAILSKHELLNVEEIDSFARAAIVSQLSIDGKMLTILSTHLSPYTEEKRMREADLIVRRLSKADDYILMGDLNSLSQYDNYDNSMAGGFNDMQTRKFTSDNKLLFEVMRLFEDSGLIDTAVIKSSNNVSTAPTSLNEFQAHSNMRLDYILVSPSLEDKVRSYSVIKNRLTSNASDHYPVVADLDIFA